MTEKKEWYMQVEWGQLIGVVLSMILAVTDQISWWLVVLFVLFSISIGEE